MHDKDTRFETRLIHAGRRSEWLRGMVNPPVHRASTILFDDVAAMEAAYPPVDGTLSYGRHGTPTQWSLAEALTELEPGAHGTRLFPSGVAAIATALLSVLKPGDELLMVDSTYSPTRHFCDELLARQAITTRYYDPLASAEEVAALITPATRALFMESPGSLSFEVQDVPGLCAMARTHGLVTLLDNSWATPFYFQAIKAGVDLAILACTKYIVGHSDVMMGAVTSTEAQWDSLSRTSRALGQAVSADDAYLTARGLRTLAVRLRQHEANALKVATWLRDQPQVERLLHPAFADCPGHAWWKRDFTGSSGLFAFVLNGGDRAARNRLVDGLKLFGLGYSWGGYESLALPINPVRSIPHSASGQMVRLHIGLEDADDLIEDLAAGLAAYA